MDFLKHPFKGKKPARDENEENGNLNDLDETRELYV